MRRCPLAYIPSNSCFCVTVAVWPVGIIFIIWFSAETVCWCPAWIESVTCQLKVCRFIRNPKFNRKKKTLQHQSRPAPQSPKRKDNGETYPVSLSAYRSPPTMPVRVPLPSCGAHCAPTPMCTSYSVLSKSTTVPRDGAQCPGSRNLLWIWGILKAFKWSAKSIPPSLRVSAQKYLFE